MNRSLSLSVALALAGGLSSFGLQANPEGAQVVHGNATFSTPSADVLNIRNSNGAVINWQRFDIAPGQTTNFIQPSADSTVLNRVIGNNPSRILGNLNSNGQVFLINQNGVLVGEGATIDTAGFFGSTLNLTDADFLAGKLRFEGGGAGDFVNRGYIRAAGGNIVLIAPNIENGGVIEVVDGEVLLAAGQSITLAGIDNPSIRFEVAAADNEVVNLGQIIAERGAASLFAGTLKHSGRIRASGLVRNADGSISLVAQDRIEISGDIDASGDAAGGRVDVRAQEILLGETGRIDASARVDGDGGEVILFADDGVSVQGEILARGGEQGGDGGFIETSGLQRLDIRRAPDASAPAGEAGQWLIDPNDITIDSVVNNASDTNIDQAGGNFSSNDDSAVLTVETIQAALDLGTNVLVQTTTSGADTEVGDIRVLADITTSSATDVSLTLQAHNDILFDSQDTNAITISATGAGALDLVLLPDSDGDGTGIIDFYTGSGGNSFPITFATNGGNVLAAGNVNLWGENGLVLNNTTWYLDHLLSVDSTASLTVLDASGSPATMNVGRGGSLLMNGSMTGSIQVETDGFLSGEGSISGNVLVAGGGLAGGDGQSSFGTLIIGGQLRFDRGLLYVVIGGVSVEWESSQVSASSIELNGGELMLVWEDATIPENVIADSQFAVAPLNLMSCIGTGCMIINDPNSFSNVIDPMMVTGSTVSLDNAVDGFVRYALTSYDTGANFVSWAGLPGGNWNDPNQWVGNAVPQATDYVFIQPQDSSSTVLVTDARSVAGMQLSANMVIGAGGSLSLNGRSMTGRSNGRGSAILLNATDATLAGTDVLYLTQTSRLQLNQGVIGRDLVSWGLITLPASANVQLDGNLAQYGYLSLEQAGSRTLSGTGSLFNAGIMDFAQDATLQLSGSQLLRSLTGNAEFRGAGTLFLNGGTTFDLAVAPATFSPDLRLVINGATLDNAQNLIMPNQLFWNSGTINGDLTIQTGQSLELAGSGSMIFNGGTLTNNGTIHFNSAGGNLFLNGQLLNNSLLSLNPTAAAVITGTGSIQQASGASMNLIASQDVTLGVDMNNAGDLFVLGGRILVDGKTLTQSAGSINVEGTGGELRVTNGGLLNVANGVGINTQADTTGGPVGSLVADTVSTIDFNDAGIGLGLLQSLYLYSGSRLQGAGGTTLASYNRIERSVAEGDSIISGAGMLTLAAGTRLDSFGGQLNGVDAANLLLIDNAGIIDTGNLDTLSLQFAQLQMSGDGVVQGNGFVDLLDTARLTAGLTTGDAQNFAPRSLYLRNDTSELVANGLVFGGNLGWYAGRISGTGLTTTGAGAFVSTSATVNELATTWTIAPGAAAEWRGDNDLLLDGGSIINQGELTILISASGDGQKTLTRTSTIETLRNEGLLLVNDIPGGVIEIQSDFDNAGGGIGIIAGTLRIDSNVDGDADDLLLDQAGEFLQGFGTYDGSVINQQGMVSPGRNDTQGGVFQAGTLTVTGDYIQGANGLLRMDLDSTAQGLLADQLVVGGDLVAGGSLNFEIINNKSVLEIAALIDQSFQPFVIGGSFANKFDSVTIPDGLNFTLGAGGVITITSDSPYLNLIADELQALIDNSDLTFVEVAEALRSPERRIRLVRSRLEQEEDRKRRRGGPRLVCR